MRLGINRDEQGLARVSNVICCREMQIYEGQRQVWLNKSLDTF